MRPRGRSRAARSNTCGTWRHAWGDVIRNFPGVSAECGAKRVARALLAPDSAVARVRPLTRAPAPLPRRCASPSHTARQGWLYKARFGVKDGSARLGHIRARLSRLASSGARRRRRWFTLVEVRLAVILHAPLAAAAAAVAGQRPRGRGRQLMSPTPHAPSPHAPCARPYSREVAPPASSCSLAPRIGPAGVAARAAGPRSQRPPVARQNHPRQPTLERRRPVHAVHCLLAAQRVGPGRGRRR